MRLTKYIIIIAIIMASINTCIDPYNPGDLKFENMLFIEAMITDDPESIPYVRFSYAFPFSENNYEGEPVVSVTGATIFLENTKGNRAYFTELSFFPGWGWNYPYYYLDDPSFTLEEGENYMLRIETTEGYIFESQYEKYLTSPPVEEVSYSYDNWETDETGESTDGYRFYVSSHADDGDPLYLRWMLNATYCYIVPYDAYYYWTGEMLLDSTNQKIKLCFSYEDIEGIYTGTSEGLAANRVSDAPLHGVSRYGDRLQIKYSLHVRQMRIPQSSYRFWNDLNSLLYETGGLYETIPFRLTGNIACVSHENISVAGVFELAGVTDKRIFVPRPVDFSIITERCIPYTIGTPELSWNNLAPGSWVMEEDGVYMTAPKTCFDCTARGGQTVVPPFWEK